MTKRRSEARTFQTSSPPSVVPPLDYTGMETLGRTDILSVSGRVYARTDKMSVLRWMRLEQLKFQTSGACGPVIGSLARFARVTGH